MRPPLRGVLSVCIAALLVLGACAPGATTPSGGAAASKTPRVGGIDRPIVFAFTPSQDVQRVTTSGNAIAAALATATGLRWKVTIPTSYAAQIESMCAGTTDIAAIAPLQMTLMLDRQCGKPILGALRKDDTGQLATTYKSQILVRKDSGITDLNGLKGKKFAFVDPISASGYLFPTLLVKNKTGQDPKTFFSQTIFAGGHDKAALAVYSGQVDGAATFIDVRTNAGMPADIMDKTVRIDTAGPIPNDGVAVAKTFPSELVAQVQKALTDYCASTDGAKQCKALFSWDGLQKVESNFYDPVRDAAKLAGVDVATEAQKTPPPPATTAPPSPSKSP
jgi:phosphonate transport system substrate-binding protein